MQTISVVVPCFNEEAVLPELFKRLSAAAATWDMEYEVICVDDGSHDDTWEIAQSDKTQMTRTGAASHSRGISDTKPPSAPDCIMRPATPWL